MKATVTLDFILFSHSHTVDWRAGAPSLSKQKENKDIKCSCSIDMADETKNIKRYFSSHYIQWLQVNVTKQPSFAAAREFFYFKGALHHNNPLSHNSEGLQQNCCALLYYATNKLIMQYSIFFQVVLYLSSSVFSIITSVTLFVVYEVRGLLIGLAKKNDGFR